VEELRSLFSRGNYKELINLATKVLIAEPENREVLYLRGVALQRTGNFEGSLEDLYQALRLEPTNLLVRDHIRQIHRRLVGQWHYDMMNDTPRNEAYKEAIERIIEPGMTVLEIGTGSGLLAMLCAKKAKHVYTCERLAPIAKVAREIIKRNGFEGKITLIDKLSTAIQVGSEIPEKVDIVVGEIFGPALLEEQALYFFHDAKERLLKPGSKFLPNAARMFGCFVECPELSRKSIVKEVYGFNLSLFNALHDDPAVQANITNYPHTFLTENFDLCENIKFGEKASNNQIKKVEFKKSGILTGICQWFELYFDGTVLSTSPNAPSTHWNQHIQLFENPVHVKKGDTLTFEVRQFSDRFSVRAIEIG